MLGGGPKQIRTDSAIGIKPISPFGTKRLVRRAIQYAIESKRTVVTLMHKGNIQKFTEGGFRDWGYEVARDEFRQEIVTERESWILDNLDKNPGLSVEQNAAMIEPGMERGTDAFRKEVYAEVKRVLDSIGATHGKGQWKQKIMVNDRIADSIFQQILTASQRVSGAGHAQSEWRLHFRRGGGRGGRAGDGAGREYRRRLRRV